MKKLNKKLRFAVAALGAVALGGLATSTVLYCMESARIAYAEDSSLSSGASSSASSTASAPSSSIQEYSTSSRGLLTWESWYNPSASQYVIKVRARFSVFDLQVDPFNGPVRNGYTILLEELRLPYNDAFVYLVPDSNSSYYASDTGWVTFDLRCGDVYGSELDYENALEALVESPYAVFSVHWESGSAGESIDSTDVFLHIDEVDSLSFYVSDNDGTFVDTQTYAPVSVGGTDIVTSIATWLTAGLNEMGAGIGAGASSFVQSLAMNGNSLSVYFIMVCAFGGIALACGLTTKIFNWLSNLGA